MTTPTPPPFDSPFAIPDRLLFAVGEGGLPFARVRTSAATAEICLHGAHVTGFAPSGAAPVVWTSPNAIFAPGKAIRGGIPVCWPWFADHPCDPGKPAHGVARTSLWEVAGSSEPEPDIVRLDLALPSGTAPELVPPGLDLRLGITVSSSLSLELTTSNHSSEPVSLTSALHTYLAVGSIESACVEGLDGCRYHDKMDGYREKRQAGDLVIDAPTDRVYEDTRADILVHDAALGRTLRIEKTGSGTTVVWNPGEEGSRKMADLPDDGYRTMLCVEAAIAGEEVLRLDPGASHTLATTISIAP